MSIHIGCGTDKGEVFAIEFNCATSEFIDKFMDREAHTSPVTTLLANKIALISGGRNGTLQSYDFDSRKKLYSFENVHETSITSLSLSADQNFLFSSSDDGIIIIWKRSQTSWENVKIIDKHKKTAVLALHPTDILALSICKDNTFRVWDLYNGKQCHKMQVRQPYVGVKISPTGKYYILHTFNLINVFELKEATLKFTVKAGGNIKDCVFVDDSTICVGELKKITFFKLSDTANELYSINLGEDQCKHFSIVQGLDKQYLIATVSSNSKASIRIYDVTSIEDNKTHVLLGTYEVPNLRITAMSPVYK